MQPATDSLREILEQTQPGLIKSLEQRSVPAGAVVVTEGDRPDAMYLIESGVADVLMADRHGVAHAVNRVGPGGVVGDLSLITGLPATATVRAATALRVRTLSHGHFRRLAASHPELYQQLAVIATERLIRANRRSLTEHPGTVHLLRDAGGPPLLAYALACSIAWHTRTPSLVLAIRRTPDPALARLSPLPVASVADLLEAAERQSQPPGAVIAAAAPEGPF